MSLNKRNPDSLENKSVDRHVILNQDRAIGIALLLVGIILFRETFSFPSTKWDPLGIAFWPRLLLGALVAISVYLIAKGSLDEGPFERLNWRAFIVLTAGVAYICLLDTIGFLCLTPPFLFLAILSLGGALTKVRVIEAALVAGLGTLFVQLVFVKGLRVFLPEGLLG